MYTEQLVVRTRFKKKQENYTSYLWIFWDSTVRTRASAAIGKNSKDRYIDIYYIIFTFVDVSIVMQDVCILLTLIYVYYIYIYYTQCNTANTKSKSMSTTKVVFYPCIQKGGMF